MNIERSPYKEIQKYINSENPNHEGYQNIRIYDVLKLINKDNFMDVTKTLNQVIANRDRVKQELDNKLSFGEHINDYELQANKRLLSVIESIGALRFQSRNQPLTHYINSKLALKNLLHTTNELKDDILLKQNFVENKEDSLKLRNLNSIKENFEYLYLKESDSLLVFKNNKLIYLNDDDELEMKQDLKTTILKIEKKLENKMSYKFFSNLEKMMAIQSKYTQFNFALKNPVLNKNSGEYESNIVLLDENAGVYHDHNGEKHKLTSNNYFKITPEEAESICGHSIDLKKLKIYQDEMEYEQEPKNENEFTEENNVKKKKRKFPFF